jgi:DNA primase catalytic core, N-terminal domain
LCYKKLTLGIHTLAERGIHVDTAKTFGVGLYSGDGFLSGRIVIPIHDHDGQSVAYAGRSLAGEEPKYRLPAGFRSLRSYLTSIAPFAPVKKMRS